MDIDDIKRCKDKPYLPELIVQDQVTDEPPGTKIILKGVRRKTAFDLNKIGVSISKKFTILDRMKVTLELNGYDTFYVTK